MADRRRVIERPPVRDMSWLVGGSFPAAEQREELVKILRHSTQPEIVSLFEAAEDPDDWEAIYVEWLNRIHK